MIRHFTTLCKTSLKYLSDEMTFEGTTKEYRPYNESCPKCGAKGKITTYGYYKRFLVSIEEQRPKETKIKPLRFKCSSCKATHALLPANLIPYSSYSLRFKLIVLIAYFERTTSVVEVCANYSIAVSTLYCWKHKLLEHKELLLGELINRKTSSLDFIWDLFSTWNFVEKLKDFFGKHGFSFMQNLAITTTRSISP